MYTLSSRSYFTAAVTIELVRLIVWGIGADFASFIVVHNDTGTTTNYRHVGMCPSQSLSHPQVYHQQQSQKPQLLHKDGSL
jgi:hypothetical protein